MDPLMLKDGVCYGGTVTSTEVQQQNTTRVQIRGSVSPSHTPQGNAGAVHVSVEVSQ